MSRFSIANQGSASSFGLSRSSHAHIEAKSHPPETTRDGRIECSSGVKDQQERGIGYPQILTNELKHVAKITSKTTTEQVAYRGEVEEILYNLASRLTGPLA
ncbi:unnamed protein product, partial [Ectocarpus sp. 8 AP-2014]